MKSELAIEGEKAFPGKRPVNFSANLCSSCLLDLGSENLKDWGRLESTAVENLTSVSIYFYTRIKQRKQWSKEGCLSS